MKPEQDFATIHALVSRSYVFPETADLTITWFKVEEQWRRNFCWNIFYENNEYGNLEEIGGKQVHKMIWK